MLVWERVLECAEGREGTRGVKEVMRKGRMVKGLRWGVGVGVGRGDSGV